MHVATIRTSRHYPLEYQMMKRAMVLRANRYGKPKGYLVARRMKRGVYELFWFRRSGGKVNTKIIKEVAL